MRRIIAIALLVLALAPLAGARVSVGASQASRIDIGAAQESQDSIEAIRRGWWERRRQGKHHERFDRRGLQSFHA